MPAQPSSRWHPLTADVDPAPGRMQAVRAGAHRLVVGRTAAGDLFALDNRCPHEGYPLAEGNLQDGALTCCWHNWKFEVSTGRCLLGGEDARRYPVRAKAGGGIEVDLAEPDPETLHRKLLASLEAALVDGDLGRAVRDGVRLLHAGYDPRALLRHVAVLDARYAEYGTTHVLPLAADMMRLLPRYPGVEAAHLITPVLELWIESNRRLPEHPRREPRPEPWQDDPHAATRQLEEAVEREDADTTEALVRGAFAAGARLDDIVSGFYRLQARHFRDFGHPLIYLVKLEELLGGANLPESAGEDLQAGARAQNPAVAVMGADALADLFVGLARRTVYGTREDTLPYLRAYFNGSTSERRAPASHGGTPTSPPRSDAALDNGAALDPVSLRNAVLDGTRADALAALDKALATAAPHDAVAAALAGAAAHRLLRFDPDIDRDAGVAEGWLWATHRLTFASAVRRAVQRGGAPHAAAFLRQALAFVHSGRKMDADPEQLTASATARAENHAGLEARLASGELPTTLRAELEDAALRAGVVRPIFLAHTVKTMLAALEEWDTRSPDDPDRATALRAAWRFLRSPLNERDARGLVDGAIAWVVDGRMPRKLTQ